MQIQTGVHGRVKPILNRSLICFIAAVSMATLEAANLILAQSGRTDYVIVSEPGIENDFAVRELTDHLQQSTGAVFSRIAVEEAGEYPQKIIIGNNAMSRRLLGAETILALQPDEAMVQVKGDDLLLLGGGAVGTLYAVYSFLENEVGCRWYTAFRDIVVPQHDILEVKEVVRRERPAFAVRSLSTYFYQFRPDKDLFFFRNRLNNGIGNYPSLPALQNRLPQIGPNSHTVFFFVNPEKEYHPAWKSYPKPPLNNFFSQHPDFFSMNAEGNRVNNLQLCFSNRELRQTLTSQIEGVINATGYAKGVVSLDANDVPGAFCHCPKCRGLEEKYSTKAGPLLDYLLELCTYLKDNHPGIYVKTLAYRKNQSEIPPANIPKLPDNLIIVFAPIDSNFAVTLDHPSNQDTLANLKRWCDLADRVWVWYYSNPYCADRPPFGNIEKMIQDVRLLKEIGIDGTFFEHGAGVPEGFNFVELQTWLFLKLFQNTAQDTEKLIDEFTDYYYAAAAPLMRSYMQELEILRKEIKIRLPWNPSITMFDYLTTDRILKWQRDFDRMEELTENSAAAQRHVRMCRVSLDIAMLSKWQELVDKHADVILTPGDLQARISRNFKTEAEFRFPKPVAAIYQGKLEKHVSQLLLQAEFRPKPLPESFSSFSVEDIRQAFPVKKLVEDPDAACGVAAAAAWDQLPFDFGLYDNYAAEWDIAEKIESAEVVADQYHSYKLGRTELTPHCLVWFTGRWIITIPIEQFYIVGEPFIKWDIYASLKFEGPAFGSRDTSKENRIYCDRIILVKADAEETGNADE